MDFEKAYAELARLRCKRHRKDFEVVQDGRGHFVGKEVSFTRENYPCSCPPDTNVETKTPYGWKEAPPFPDDFESPGSFAEIDSELHESFKNGGFDPKIWASEVENRKGEQFPDVAHSTPVDELFGNFRDDGEKHESGLDK